MIGSFGDVVFEVSSQTLRTFSGFTRTTTARWSDHEVLNQKPVSEYSGPALDTISFTVRFDVTMGVDPFVEMSNLAYMCARGTPAQLIIGYWILGENLWVCTSATQNWKTVDNQGNVLVAEMQLSLKEYI